MSVNARFDAVAKANSRLPKKFARPTGPDGRLLALTDYYGVNTFSLKVMADKLPKPVYKRVRACVEQGDKLTRADADMVAHAVKEWAIDKGVTHYTHWFQPMTGNTAEKHDAFLTTGEHGAAMERFSGASLIQGEPDASSFPSGGTRSTFEARGYTAWDPSSPMFIMEHDNGATLCIPSAFVSYTGEALDKKTPLLRSMAAIDRAAGDLLEAMGRKRLRVVSTVGVEQEYFLVDRAYWPLRPDLAIGGRTVAGMAPPKGQSLDDHYFGSITPRVLAYMAEVELELYKLGVPAKTRHNEVAPSQYEIAPIYSEANVGVDHNQLIAEVLRRVALRHDFKVLLAEKPFAGINGSGKHNNWALSAGGENLLEPGDNPVENLRFLAVLASVLLGVYRYQGLMRASVASYGNDFRLGANEAPPAIISVFLGQMLTRICDAIEGGGDLPENPDQAMLELGVSSIPHVMQDNTDRNRTSPMAFTGNKFEFRAVGSDQNPGWSTTVLNTIVAEGMRQIVAWINHFGGGSEGVFKAIQEAIRESSAIRFEGDGYSDEWVVEAAKRGLKNLKKTPEALKELTSKEVIELFDRHRVLSPAELDARFHIFNEQYVTAVDIEGDAMRILVDEMILPVALGYRAKVARDFKALLDIQSAGVAIDTEADARRLNKLSALINEAQAARAAMDAAFEASAKADDHAQAYVENVLPAFDALRAAVDGIEGVVPDELWSMPKYREMLFLV